VLKSHRWGFSYLPTIGIIVSMISRVMHTTIGIGAYQFRYNTNNHHLILIISITLSIHHKIQEDQSSCLTIYINTIEINKISISLSILFSFDFRPGKSNVDLGNMLSNLCLFVLVLDTDPSISRYSKSVCILSPNKILVTP